MVMKNKVARLGESGTITLPSDVLSTLRISEGQEVWLEIDASRQRLVLSPITPAAAFWAPASAAELSARQDVRPVSKLEDLAGDFWPEDESVDDFRQAVRLWRADDQGA